MDAEVESFFKEAVTCLIERSDKVVLPSGATELEIHSFEIDLGHPLPEKLKQIYRLHDGEFDFGLKPTIGLFCDYEFLSLRHVRELCSRWEITRDFWATPGMEEPFTFMSRPEHAVKCVLSSPGWIPIGGWFGGNHLAVDFDPGPTGVSGQIINFGPDDEVHFQIAPNFDSFLALILHHYQQQEWHSSFGTDWSSLYDELKRQYGI